MLAIFLYEWMNNSEIRLIWAFHQGGTFYYRCCNLDRLVLFIIYIQIIAFLIGHWQNSKTTISKLWKKKVDFSPISCIKCTILHSKWTLKKVCCFFLISLRSIINLAHAFKSPFLDIEITNIRFCKIKK